MMKTKSAATARPVRNAIAIVSQTVNAARLAIAVAANKKTGWNARMLLHAGFPASRLSYCRCFCAIQRLGLRRAGRGQQHSEPPGYAVTMVWFCTAPHGLPTIDRNR